MGQFLNVPVVNGKALLRNQNYVLFRWREKETRQSWRMRYMLNGPVQPDSFHSIRSRDVPVPAFLSPVPAKIHNFQSLQNAAAEMKRHWGGGTTESLAEEIYHPFFDIMYSLLHHREVMKIGYGLHGLYSRTGKELRLESVHALLPFADHTTGDMVPLVAACIKAPWNFMGINWKSSMGNQDKECWGIDWAILMHAVRTFYRSEKYSFGEQMVVNWRMGFLFPISEESDLPRIPFPVLLEYLNKQDLPELRSDALIFGIEMEKPSSAGLGIFQNRGKEWIVYGLRMDAETAERSVLTYQYWIEQMFAISGLM
jgi:hypothetical protein